jgi:hypothetical protein
MCVFHQESYINLLQLLLKSIVIRGSINKETTDILIVTSTELQPLIQEKLENFDLSLNYYILNLTTLFESACARLEIFDYNNINKYDNILYLDVDILINSDINILFNLDISSEKIYALEEGEISNINHGGQFFDFSKINQNTTAFTSGILLFKNSASIKQLFNTIKSHIIDYIYTNKNSLPECLDQPFIIYNAISQNKYDNKILNKYVENNPSVVSSEKIVYHFPGGLGDYSHKFPRITNFWEIMNKGMIYIFKSEELANINHYENCSSEKEKLLDNLKTIVVDSKVTFEGNCFYYHNSTNLYSDLYNKQLNLFWCGKQANTKICEIGFNAGHSSMLMLLGRDKTPLDFTIFDIGHHSYTKPSLNYIRSQFQHINFEYIEGDSTVTMPKWIEENNKCLGVYDVVHIDGGHSEHCISNDIKNTDLIVKIGGIVIVDDTNAQEINKYVDLYISNGKYREINVLKTKGYPHRIIQKLM